MLVEFNKQEKRVIAAITKGEEIDLSRVTFGLGEAIEPILREIYVRFAKRTWNQIAEDTGRLEKAKARHLDGDADDIDPRVLPLAQLEITEAGIVEDVTPLAFEVLNPFIEEALQQQVIEISASTAATTSAAIDEAIQDVRDTLAEGATQGEATAALVTRVQEVFDRAPKWKARQIAITESSRAVADAGIIAANQTGVIQGFRFVPSADACELCQVYTANDVATGVPLVPFTDGADAQRQIGQFKNRTMAPIHPNCRCINVPILDIEPQPETSSMQRKPQLGKKPR